MRESPRPSRGTRAFRSVPASRWTPASERVDNAYAVKELPQPQPPVALGFLKVKPEPCIDDT